MDWIDEDPSVTQAERDKLLDSMIEALDEMDEGWPFSQYPRAAHYRRSDR